MNKLLVRPEKFRNRMKISDLSICRLKTASWSWARPIMARQPTGSWPLWCWEEFAPLRVRVASGRESGKRETVFDGLPYTLYLPIHTCFTVTATEACDLAFCYCKAEEEYPARLVTPSMWELRFVAAATPHGRSTPCCHLSFLAHRLMVVEVFTPAGNWSSFPPHKHDVHNPPGEVDLEEIYYYRIQREEGFAIQKVYTADRRIDETMTVRDGELVLIPEGYHPVVAAHGYDVYYLNALAGSARSLAASDDPNYAWVRGDWREKIRGCRW